jgi:hypothetical protein
LSCREHYTGTSRLATYTDETRSLAVSATYSYDALGQCTRSEITEESKTTTIDFVYEGLALLSISATEVEGENQKSWSITYLYDENGRPYAGIYRDPAESTTPVVFGMVTTDRGDIVELLDANRVATGHPTAQPTELLPHRRQAISLRFCIRKRAACCACEIPGSLEISCPRGAWRWEATASPRECTVPVSGSDYLPCSGYDMPSGYP